MAEGLSTRMQVLVPPGTDSLQLDSFPIMRSSAHLRNRFGDSLSLDFRLRGSQPAWLFLAEAQSDSLYLHYRRLPLRLYSPFFRKDSSLILPATTPLREGLPAQSYAVETEEFSPFSSLNSQGALSRSVSVGNNQDAVLNSALNLQLNGQIGENTALRASISDNTLPVQADGSTQQLREFDRLYLELENPDFGLLRAGDYDIGLSDAYFLRFQKRISGAGLQSAVKRDSERSLPFGFQAGLARGKFARNRFQGEEGNQGPYKLQGAEGEQFIIIISGSERVYIDGRLLKRGEQNDYIIDYNAGELTFTALQPITRDRRIVIEFQYTQQNYLRSTALAEVGWRQKNWQTQVQYFTEQDSKNQPLAIELSEEERARLAAVGDNLEEALISTIRPAPYDAQQSQYRLVDSLGFDSVLVFTQDSTAVLYNASFSFVGAGRGDYRQASAGSNGRVFEWVAPQNGERQGSFAPLRRLVAPNRLQVLHLSSRAQWDEKQNLSVDLASSQRDLNLFSERDAGDNNGLAGRLNYARRQKLGAGQMLFEGSVEFNSEDFRSVERVRPVEFARDWNLPLNYEGAVQLSELSAGYQSDSLSLGYRFAHLRAGAVGGQRHALQSEALRQRHSWLLRGSVTESEGEEQNSRFWREDLRYRYKLRPRWWLGLESVGEWNRRRAPAFDSLFATSYQFYEYRAFSGWGDTTQNFVELGYLQRWDDSVRQGRMSNSALAQSLFGRSTWRSKHGGRLQLAVYYRRLQLRAAGDQAPEQRSLTSRLSYNQRFWKNAIVSTSFYESGAGTEPRRSFVYVEVPIGTGTHIHTDYNGNGRRELDEFEASPSPELGNFVRVFSPNLEFVRTSRVKLGQNLNLNAPQTWQRGSAWQKTLARFSSVLAYQLDQRSLLQDGLNQLSPLSDIADSLLVGFNNSFRQTLFFNRSRTAFGGDYTFRQNDNRNLITQGIEQRRTVENQFNLRWTPQEDFILRWRGSFSEKDNRSGNFPNRNFGIGGQSHRSSLSYQGSQQLSLTGSYTWEAQESNGEGASRLRSQRGALEGNYNLADQIALQFEAAYIFNDFSGEANSPVGFEMLQALRPGRNATFNLSLQRSFLKNIVLSLNYLGRFSQDLPAIHAGNLQVKAFF